MQRNIFTVLQMELLDACKDINMAELLEQAARNHVMYGQVLAYVKVFDELGHKVIYHVTKGPEYYHMDWLNVDGFRLYYRIEDNAE